MKVGRYRNLLLLIFLVSFSLSSYATEGSGSNGSSSSSPKQTVSYTVSNGSSETVVTSSSSLEANGETSGSLDLSGDSVSYHNTATGNGDVSVETEQFEDGVKKAGTLVEAYVNGGASFDSVVDTAASIITTNANGTSLVNGVVKSYLGTNIPGLDEALQYATSYFGANFNAQAKSGGKASIMSQFSGSTPGIVYVDNNSETAIQDAVSSVQPNPDHPDLGTLIVVNDGIYHENVAVSNTAHPMHIVSENGATKAQITAADPNNDVVSVSNSPNFFIAGLSMSGGTNGVGIYNSSSAIIIANSITGNGSGIAVDSSSSDAVIAYNTISGNTNTGISSNGDNAAISHNTIAGNATGIQTSGNNAKINYNNIYSNLTGINNTSRSYAVDATHNYWGGGSSGYPLNTIPTQGNVDSSQPSPSLIQ
jgi:hypothetical protein